LSGAGPCVGEASLGMIGQPIKSRTAILQVKRTPYYPCMLKPINTCHQGSMGHSRGRLDCIHIPDRQPRVGCIRHLAGLEKKESQRIGYGKWKRVVELHAFFGTLYSAEEFETILLGSRTGYGLRSQQNKSGLSSMILWTRIRHLTNSCRGMWVEMFTTVKRHLD
jgi:hypothetical protein